MEEEEQWTVLVEKDEIELGMLNLSNFLLYRSVLFALTETTTLSAWVQPVINTFD